MLDDRLGSDVSNPPSTDEDATSPTLERFRTCRWAKTAEQDTAEHCTHRDVLPFAGTSGFNPEAWCPDCAFYKVRRTSRRNASS